MRKKLLIKKEFQIKIILIVMLCVFIFANITVALVFYFLSDKLSAAMTFENPLAADNFYGAIIPSLALIQLVGLFVIFYLSLYISHRMAGPVYRLENLCGKMSEGDFSFDVKVRDSDEFQELARHLDRMCASVRSGVFEIRESYSSVIEARNKLAELIDKKCGGDESLKNELAELAGRLDMLNAKIGFFVVEKPESAPVKENIAEA